MYTIISLMRKFLCNFLLLVCAMMCAGNTYASSDAGTTAANFLKIPVAPVPTALSEAYTALSGADSVMYNPAGMALMNYSTLSAAHNQYFMDMMQEYVALNLKFPFGTVSAHYSSLSSGKFDGYDSEDNNIGSISAQFSVMGLSFSKVWPYYEDDKYLVDPMIITPYWGSMQPVTEFRQKTYRFATGFTVKRISEDLYESTAETLAFDAGVMLVLPGHWQFGASALNYGGKIKHKVQSFDTPSSLRFGVARDFHSRNDVIIFTGSADAVKYTDNDMYGAFGIEANISKILQIRTGYKTEKDTLTSFTAGAGMNFDTFTSSSFMKGARLDYAFASYGSFGATHRIGFQIIW